MKKTLLSTTALLVLLAICSFAIPSSSPQEDTTTGKNVKWMTFEEAVAATSAARAAGKKPKKMFMDIYTDWCGWCKKMDAETFEKPEVAKYLNENFYPIKFNAEQKESIEFAGNTFKYVANGRRGYHELAAALLGGKMSYPTVVFAHFNNNNFEMLQRIPGYLNIPTFDAIMHYLAEDHYTSTPWDEYQKNYNQEAAPEPAAVKQPTPPTNDKAN